MKKRNQYLKNQTLLCILENIWNFLTLLLPGSYLANNHSVSSSVWHFSVLAYSIYLKMTDVRSLPTSTQRF